MRQLRPETGESLAIFFKTLIKLYLFCLFLYFWLTVSKRVSKSIFLDITFKSVGLWGSYSLKQGNHLQNIKFSNHIVFVLSPSLLFYLTYQKDYWIPCIFFKILIQLYLLPSFIYYLTHFIKEVIKGKIFWRLNKKVVLGV